MDVVVTATLEVVVATEVELAAEFPWSCPVPASLATDPEPSPSDPPNTARPTRIATANTVNARATRTLRGSPFT